MHAAASSRRPPHTRHLPDSWRAAAACLTAQLAGCIHRCLYRPTLFEQSFHSRVFLAMMASSSHPDPEFSINILHDSAVTPINVTSQTPLKAMLAIVAKALRKKPSSLLASFQGLPLESFTKTTVGQLGISNGCLVTVHVEDGDDDLRNQLAASAAAVEAEAAILGSWKLEEEHQRQRADEAEVWICLLPAPP